MLDITLYNYNEDSRLFLVKLAHVYFKVYKTDRLLLREARGFILFAIVQNPETLFDFSPGLPEFRIETIIKSEPIKLRTNLPEKEFEKLNTIEVAIIDKVIFVRLINKERGKWNSFWFVTNRQMSLVLQRVLKKLENLIHAFGKLIR